MDSDDGSSHRHPTQVPLRSSSSEIHQNAKWNQTGVTVAGGNEEGNGINQLNCPWGLYVDDDQTVYIADESNHRIMEWKSGAANGKIVAGGNQLNHPEDVIIDKERDSLIISDYRNRRIVRWRRRDGISGETIISDISCVGLTMDDKGCLYVVDHDKNEVKRYRIGESQGTLVAGGNGRGSRLDQLSDPYYVFVDRDYSVDVSDNSNHRVMKWEEGATQGILVAGGHGCGSDLTQLNGPLGIVVDNLGTIYVTDRSNHRIMRWPKGSTQGTVIAGGNDLGSQSNQLTYPYGLSFDRQGNLYVADQGNHRIQKFEIE
ncbi:unnamed protein product [Rotaria magnacalcarata]|uniref:Uncharacterized protein n=2 Tax=Rotaria magnacalcarata TaxID=392030 RepID=A0A816M2N3_9BILA|nr:unnamed protein product [Rotaria magnacalcarata]